MTKTYKEYEIGVQTTDELISKLAKLSASSPETEDLLREILTTAVKLGLESSDRGDLKLINNALKELRYSFKIFAPYRNVKKVIIFGSARSANTSSEYKMAEEFSRKITAKGYMIVTGGGGGVMEAGNKGAEHGKEFALNIRLPYEQKPNPYIDEKQKLINFKYFFTRKLVFIKETDATTLFPGGFGTNDEGFEAITLIQTGKSRPRPILLMQPQGSTYWTQWKKFLSDQLVKNGFIKKEDFNLFKIITNVDDAVKYIEDFYRIYHSIRYASGLTVLRLNKTLSDKTLKLINQNFKDILTKGDIKLSPPTNEEIKKQEYLDLPRLVMKFNQHDYGRLLELINVINKD
ncbi:MAG: TIGR00730 family Rossman fold protein [Candidatus Omnitrophica bacterium]|nr:TIGR00730 family Rossman fold protein [Candidatus Omnitrophota bacterium]MBU1047845.1 TIGR00730 family Rossman fold protein [Candidatus Omnitrophota bacterium]MBU1630511.1 TIGR00730 family Rossman fold protein [Candidatus Omnitrophota bacterium]MBU1767434.1 TIGR00730 family Rossman fold protein [Candidatus Omnitrophota bacterium]MBU1888467.1 TIGR00730 family Rossman fold protein [Candidatus Omnitrophota bacterium]